MDANKEGHTHHISQQFNQELESVRMHLLEMGGRVERQVQEAVQALIDGDDARAEEVSEGDRDVNAMEISIDEECTRILARRQPAASDLRLIMAIGKANTDLERIGDEANRIARQAIALTTSGRAPGGYAEVGHLSILVRQMLRDSLDAFARLDAEQAVRVAQADREVDTEYAAAMRGLVTYMMEDARSISRVLNLIWVLRSLERIGDHARNIAEYVVYLVKGKDVRHAGLDAMQAEVFE